MFSMISMGKWGWFSALLACLVAGPADAGPGDRPFRILCVHSYHAEWSWCRDQVRGFLDGLDLPGAEFREVEMDTKRRPSEEWKRKVAAEILGQIRSWKPDLVYATDDNAQQYVGARLVGGPIPVVFSGVNADPSVYGYNGAENVTGVLEREHFVQTVNLLREIVPGVRRIAVVVDEGSTWPGVVERMKAALPRLGDVEVVAWDRIGTFAAFRDTMRGYEGRVDAVGLLGVFTFEDEGGNTVPFEKVLRWVADHSRLPDFSFWDSRIPYGTLCAVAVSGYEQGLAAGRLARTILVNGASPASLPIRPTVRGEPFVSLARARALGLRVPSSVLLSSRVFSQFAWQQ